jgi:hypothetical protein
MQRFTFFIIILLFPLARIINKRLLNILIILPFIAIKSLNLINRIYFIKVLKASLHFLSILNLLIYFAN